MGPSGNESLTLPGRPECLCYFPFLREERATGRGQGAALGRRKTQRKTVRTKEKRGRERLGGIGEGRVRERARVQSGQERGKEKLAAVGDVSVGLLY